MNHVLWGCGVLTASSHSAERDLRRWRDEVEPQDTIALRCQICDSPVLYIRHSTTEQCLFCGSEDLTVLSEDRSRRSCDVEDGEFSSAYYEPRICFDGACAIIAKFSAIDRVHLNARGVYFPVWDVLLHVNCVWEGESCTPTSIGSFPVRRLQRGSFDYQTNEIRLPVTPILAEDYIVTIAGGTEWAQLVDGPPVATDAFCIVLPTLSKTEAWQRFEGDVMVREDAYERCERYCERPKSIKPIIQAKHFSLVYLPVALVSSHINGKERGYFVNLLNGAIGEIQASTAAFNPSRSL